MFWFDKSDSRVLFGDVRDESWELCDGRRFEVKPDMLMDYRDLPFPDETFRMVVLDPPHLRTLKLKAETQPTFDLAEINQ